MFLIDIIQPDQSVRGKLIIESTFTIIKLFQNESIRADISEYHLD